MIEIVVSFISNLYIQKRGNSNNFIMEKQYYYRNNILRNETCMILFCKVQF